jgi:uncharacterized protein
MEQAALISGASGLIGRALASSLVEDGWQVKRLVRHTPGTADEIAWSAIEKDSRLLEGFEAVIHLSGEPVFGLWTADKKRRIRDSRVLTTQGLSKALAACAHPPRTMICASAVGYYGDRADEILTEDSPPGSGFLADTCVEWEQAAQPAREADIRVLHLRTGIVLAKHGGALKSMLPAFKLGVAGKLGSGLQYFPWLSLRDAVSIIRYCMQGDIAGPVNTVAPQTVTNAEFTATLARVLHRPAVIPVPAFILKLAPGGMGPEALLASTRVVPEKLDRAGFKFADAELEPALRRVLAAD